MKKILLTLLAVFMFATAGTANVLADTTTGNDIYVSFGDSITRGLGSQPDKTTEECEASDENIRIVTGAYNTIVAEDLGIIAKDPKYEDKDGKPDYADKYYASLAKSNYLPVAGYGLTVEDALKLLAGETEDLGWRGAKVFDIYGKDKDEDVVKAITNAKSPLITVNLGLMDVAMYSSADKEFQDEITKVFEAAGGNTEQALLSIIPAYEKAMFKAYSKWVTNYDKLIGQLTKLNTKADMVLVGFFNPLRGVNYKVSLGEDKGYILLPIGVVLDPIVALMNETTRFIAKKYNVKYADVSNGEGMNTATEEAINDLVTGDDLEFATHGTAATYEYMARQIEGALAGTKPAEDHEYDIVVDLIRNTVPTDANEGISKTPAYDITYSYSLDGGEPVDVTSSIKDTTLTAKANDKNAKLLQVFITTHGTKAGTEDYDYINPSEVYVIPEHFDKDTFEADQKIGKIVKLDADGNPVVKYNKEDLEDVIAQPKQDGDVWVHCDTVSFVPDQVTIEFKYDTEKELRSALRNGTAVEYPESSGKYVVAEPKKNWWGRVIGADIVYDTVPVDFTEEYLVEKTEDLDSFTKDQIAGKIVGLNIKDDGTYEVAAKIENGRIVPQEDIINCEKWVVSEAKKNGYGQVVAVIPKTVTPNVPDTKVTNVEVRTYLLMWRGDHYEAYSIDSTNSVEARVEKILSPITEPIAKAKADFEEWITDWYNHTDFAPYLDQFALSVKAYKDAKDAIEDADAAIGDAQAVADDAAEKELFARQALEKAIVTPSWTYSDDVQKASDAYKAAQEATKEAKADVTAAQKDAIQARLDVLPAAGDAVKKGIEYAQSASKWAWDYITHLN